MYKKFYHFIISAAPKNRPVTANRKTIDNTSSYSTTTSLELANAMLEENKRIEEFRGLFTFPNFYRNKLFITFSLSKESRFLKIAFGF